MSTANPPPSPSGVPLLGNGLAFSRAPFDALVEWADRGDVVRVSVGEELVFDKAEHGREIDVDRIVEAVDSHVSADVEPSAAIGIDGKKRDGPPHHSRRFRS